MPSPVAVVTGACSGIGLALVHHLVQHKWDVVMADVNPPSENVEGTIFVQTDIVSWDEQALLFEKAYQWRGRLDFCALHAGIDDRDDLFFNLEGEPRRPNMKTFEVTLFGTYYGIGLASHYMAKTNDKAGKLQKGGKIIITGSGAGLWPIPAVPQYTAVKHAVVGLGRAIGRSESAKLANIRINVLCPAIVATAAPPPGLLDALDPEQLTPITTVIDGFDRLADLQNGRKEDWVQSGPNGEVLEANGSVLIEHPPPPRSTQGNLPSPETLACITQSYKARVEAHAKAWEEQQKGQ